MGIRFQCPNGHKLNVKAELAGKRASCPECGVKLVIPAASPEPSSLSAAAAEAQGANSPEPATFAWHVRPAGGGEFGPATEAMFRAWIAEGRVTADSQIRRDDWAAWKLARDAADDLPIPLAAVPVATPPEPPAAIPAAPSPKPVEKPVEKIEKIDIPAIPEPLAAAMVEAVPSKETPAPSVLPATPFATPLAAEQYKLQRRRTQKAQLTLAIVMLVAVIVLAGVLVWVIRNSGSPAGAASIRTSTRPAAAGVARPTKQGEAT